MACREGGRKIGGAHGSWLRPPSLAPEAYRHGARILKSVVTVTLFRSIAQTGQ